MDLWPTLRAQLIARRQEMGLSQRELAERMATHQSVLSDYESGKTSAPQLPNLLRWCDALEIDLEVVLHLRGITIPGRTVRLRE